MKREWDVGIRYFDTAPFYGHGLSEEHLGTLRSLEEAAGDSGPHPSIPLSSTIRTTVTARLLDEAGG